MRGNVDSVLKRLQGGTHLYQTQFCLPSRLEEKTFNFGSTLFRQIHEYNLQHRVSIFDNRQMSLVSFITMQWFAQVEISQAWQLKAIYCFTDQSPPFPPSQTPWSLHNLLPHTNLPLPLIWQRRLKLKRDQFSPWKVGAKLQTWFPFGKPRFKSHFWGDFCPKLGGDQLTGGSLGWLRGFMGFVSLGHHTDNISQGSQDSRK